MKIRASLKLLKMMLSKTRVFILCILNRGYDRYCPVCKKSSKRFGKFGLDSRDDAQCLYCGSLERHRLTWLYFERMTNLFDKDPKKMLHVAPEACFEERLKKQLGMGYISADIDGKRAMIQMDITRIQFDDETFDVIYCSHVLEHVVNEKAALLEFYRVLKKDGWAILLVPIVCEKTYEDPLVTDPAMRLQLFGQEDHVRNYGSDYIQRLKKAGFSVRIIKATDFLKHDEIEHMGITQAAGEVYYCTKIDQFEDFNLEKN
jgi:predicted SAM-dependent methyltransferase